MMAKEVKCDFGRYLQSFRMAQGRSIEEIAQKTRITQQCLQQIENEDLKNLPQAVFVKGFLRAYAGAVGADADETIQRYRNRRRLRQQYEPTDTEKSPGAGFWYRLLWVLVLFVGVVGVTIYMAPLK